MNQKVKDDLRAVLDYLWQDESRHYAEGPSKSHIFRTLKRLAKEVGYKRS